MRLIDADALIDFFSNIQKELGAERISFKSVNRAIDAMATIEAVPKDFHDKTCEAMVKRHTEEIANMVSVVRCKECKFWIGHISDDDGFDEGLDECRWRDSEAPDADDFCSYGEREGE